MRYILLVIFLCAIPFVPSHANQQVAETITAIEIEGVNVLTSVEDARSILISKGYEEGTSSPRSTRFKKNACYIEVGHMMSTSMLKYKCDGSNLDVNAVIAKALADLCAIESNGKEDRSGCLPAGANTSPTRIEEFQMMVDGNKYTAKIWDIQNNAGTHMFHIDIITTIRK